LSLRYGVLCLLALFIMILLAFENYETWTAPSETGVEKVSPKKSSVKPEGSQPAGDPKDPKAPPSIASYIFVAEKNIFHPDRKEFPVVTQPQAPVPKPPPVRPQITLYGVTIVADYKSASISYAGRVLRKGEREIMTAKIGEPIGQFKLVQILPDRIGLEHPEDKFEVFLYDARTPKKRVSVKTENKPATLTSTVPGAPTPAGEPVREGVATAAAPTPVTPAAVPSPRARRFFGPRPAGAE
jgi:hypothetical protein